MVASSQFCPVCGAANPLETGTCMDCGETLESNPSPLSHATGLFHQGQLLHQRYRILGQIGQGGFAAVYKAEDTHFYQRLVAIKEMSQSGLSPQERAEAIQAFTREAQMLASLQHPSLPRIYDYFSEHRRWYLVMDFLEGETLEHMVLHRSEHRLSLRETIALGLELCAVLDYLHTRRPPVIFRDLKPANILRGPTNHLYLIDFGIARHFKPGQARDTVAFGSPGYAAPEQYGKAQTTPQSDIYSLGVLLHHLLSGDDPADRPFLLAPLRLYGGETLAELEALITQMTQLDSERRPASIAEVQQRLRSLATQREEQPANIIQSPSPQERIPERSRTQETSRTGQEQAQEQVLEHPINRSRRKFVIGGLLAGVALAAGAGSMLSLSRMANPPHVHPTPRPLLPHTGPETMFGVDAQHTHFIASEHTLSPANVAHLSQAWVTPLDGENIFSSPMVSGDTLYIGTLDGRLLAFDIVSGKERWATPQHGNATTTNGSTPAVANGKVYICLQDRRLHAFDAATGKEQWVAPFADSMWSSPTIASNLVYVTGEKRLYAFDAASGKLEWSNSITSLFPAATSPAVSHDLVYIVASANSAGTGRLMAFGATNGRLAWTSDLIEGGIDTNASPTVANGLVYIGAEGGLAAFDALTGHVRWTATPTKGTTGSSVAVANGLVYLAVDQVYAFDALSGSLRWTSEALGASNSDSPVVANGVVYVCAAPLNSPFMYALDATTGRTLWSSPTLPDQTFTTPTVANGVVYVSAGNRNATLFAFRLHG